MRGQGFDPIECRRFRDRGLQRQPFVDDQRIVGVADVEIFKRLRALGADRVDCSVSSAAMRSVMLSAL